MITKEEIKSIRRKLKLTQEQLAAKVGLTREYIGKIERGDAEISEATEAVVTLLIIKEKHLLKFSSISEIINQNDAIAMVEEPQEGYSTRFKSLGTNDVNLDSISKKQIALSEQLAAALEWIQRIDQKLDKLLAGEVAGKRDKKSVVPESKS